MFQPSTPLIRRIHINAKHLAIISMQSMFWYYIQSASKVFSQKQLSFYSASSAQFHLLPINRKCLSHEYLTVQLDMINSQLTVEGATMLAFISHFIVWSMIVTNGSHTMGVRALCDPSTFIFKLHSFSNALTSTNQHIPFVPNIYLFWIACFSDNAQVTISVYRYYMMTDFKEDIYIAECFICIILTLLSACKTQFSAHRYTDIMINLAPRINEMSKTLAMVTY